MMEFKMEELIEREIEIGSYLVRDFSLKNISEKTGLSKKLLAAHIRNMMKKLKVENMSSLKKILEEKFGCKENGDLEFQYEIK